MRIVLHFLAVLGLVLTPVSGVASESRTMVFAAASLTDVMEALAEGFETETGRVVTLVTGSSSTLARQIEAGAPADLFFSANRNYAEAVAEKMGAEAYDLFGNQLVIVAPEGFDGHVSLETLVVALGDGRLAVGDPAHVPAGIYAQEAMENAGVWGELEARLAPASDVRGALAFVAQGAAPFGIVYKTDAMIAGVTIAGEIDPELHTPVRYWGVMVNSESETADMFLSYVGSFKAQNLLDAMGFTTLMSAHD